MTAATHYERRRVYDPLLRSMHAWNALAIVTLLATGWGSELFEHGALESTVWTVHIYAGYAGGRVRVRTGIEGSSAVLEVVDSGPGIPAAERERVQERFYRILGTGEEGSGLGLSIARRICELHGARLALEDGPGGVGLRAQVSFPRRG